MAAAIALTSALLATGATPSSAAPTAPTTAERVGHDTSPDAPERASAGRLKVKVTTPSGVPASIRLRGTRSVVVQKPAKGGGYTKSVKLPAGRYRVAVDPVVADGVLHTPLKVARKVVVKKGKTTTLKIKLVRAGATQLGVATVGATTADLRWKAPSRSTFVLRRAVGAKAPTTRTQGTGVAVAGSTARDSRLAPRTTYSYALFVRKSGVWAPPVTTTLTTSPAGSGGGAAVRLPGAVVVPPSADPNVTVKPGEVTYRPKVGAAVPPLGGGIVLPQTDAMPFGFVGTVSSISADGRTVTLEPGALVDVFSYLDLDVDLADVPAQRLRPRTAGAQSKSAGDRKAGCGIDASSALPGIGLDLAPDGHMKLGIHNSFGIPDGFTYDVRFAPTFTYASGFHVAAAVSCTFEFRALFSTIPNPLGLPLAIKAGSEVSLSTEESADIDRYELSATVGGYTKGTLSVGSTRVDKSGEIFEVGPVEEQTGSAPFSTINVAYGSRVTVGIGGGTTALGAIGGISGHVEPVNITFKDRNGGSSTPCRNIDVASSAGLGLNVSAWAGPLSASATLDFVSVKASWPAFPRDFPAGCGATGPPVISTAALPAATIGVPYTARLRMSDDRPGTWELASGSLPDGLELDADGTVSGTPAPPKATLDFVVKVTDNRGRSTTKPFSLTVDGFAPQGLTSSVIPVTLPGDAISVQQSSPLTFHSCAPGTPDYCVSGGSYRLDGNLYEPYLVVHDETSTTAVTFPREGAGRVVQLIDVACPEPGWCAVLAYDTTGNRRVLAVDGADLVDLGTPTVPGTTGPGHLELTSLSCVVAGDCALAGAWIPSSGPTQAVVAELDGTAVTAALAPLPAAANPAGASSLARIACRPSGYCLAMGSSASAGAPFVLAVERDNGSWTGSAAPMPAGGFGFDVGRGLVCAADGECAAVGRANPDGRNRAVVIRRHAGAWTTVELPLAAAPAQGDGPVDLMPQEISCPTPSDCVVVAQQYDANVQYPYYPVLVSTVSRLKNGTWSTTRAPDMLGSDSREPQGRLTNVDCSSPGNCVVAGTSYLGTYGGGVRRAVGFVLNGSEAPEPLAGPDNASSTYVWALDCTSAARCIVAGHYDVGYSASPGVLVRLDLTE